MTDTRWWEGRGFVILALLLAAAPLAWPPIPPLIDVPGHMGRYRVMLGTDAELLSGWYDFTWRPIGYLGVDLLVAALGPLLGLEAAVKLIVLAIPVLTAGGILWISREVHGRIEPLAIFALPLVYHLALQYGFVNYCLAMALALNAFALWLRLARVGRFRLRAALFVPLSCAIWTAHLFGWLVLGLLAISAELARSRAGGRSWPAAIVPAAVACLPLALPFAMFLAWRPGDATSADDYWAGLRFKPGWLVTALRDRWQAFDLAAMTLIALVLYRCARAPRFEHAPALTLAAAGLLLVFVLMPFGAAYADARFAPYVVILALLSVRAGDGVGARERATLALIGMALLLVRTAATSASFAIESRAWTRHLAALDHVPRGARMVTFAVAGCEAPWRMYRLGHLAGMAIVRRAAFSNDQFDLGSTALLKVVAPGLDGFATDPSQIVTDAPCAHPSEFRTLAGALGRFPRDRFDLVWLIGAPPAFRPTPDLPPLWRRGDDWLLRVEHTKQRLP